MKAKIKFGAKTDEELEYACVVSEISWQDLRPYIEAAFARKHDEVLMGIEVSDTSIKAKFKTVPKSAG